MRHAVGERAPQRDDAAVAIIQGAAALAATKAARTLTSLVSSKSSSVSASIGPPRKMPALFDEHVQPSERRDRLRHGTLDGRGIGIVRLDGEAAPAGRLNLGDDGPRLVRGSRVGERDVGAIPRQLFCNRGADATAAAGDQRDAARQSKSVSLMVLSLSSGNCVLNDTQ